MKDNINKIALEWIGEDKVYTDYLPPEEEYATEAYNQALQDLRNKAPELTEKIIEEMVKIINGEGFADTSEAGQFKLHADGYNQAIEDIIYLLKKDETKTVKLVDPKDIYSDGVGEVKINK